MNLEKTPKSYRFKGGIIGAVLGIISIIVFFTVSFPTNPIEPSKIFLILASPVLLFWGIIYFPKCGIYYEGFTSCFILSCILASVLTLASLIALGVLIGWIIEKIKNR